MSFFRDPTMATKRERDEASEKKQAIFPIKTP
jgi:hypothetical protein